MENVREKLFSILYNRSFVYREDPPFTLVSGLKSPYYFDCKATTLDPEGCYLTGRLFFNEIEDMDIDAAGGLTLGADPISLSIALEAFRNDVIIYPLIVRKEPKKHGTQKWIEGNLEKVKTVAVIDDVITTGQSTILAIERMREAGLEVKKALVMIDRQEGGRENIEKLGVDVISLFRKSDFNSAP
jgi:orotate phosphoribosyltransferase